MKDWVHKHSLNKLAERIFKHSFARKAVFTSIIFKVNNKGTLLAFFSKQTPENAHHYFLRNKQ